MKTKAAAVIVILCTAFAGCKKKPEQPSEPKKKDDAPLAHRTPVEPRPRGVRPAPIARTISPLVSVQWLKQHLKDKNASILNGGVPAWKKAGNPVATDAPKHGKGNIILKDFDPTLIVKMEELKKVQMLIDCRPPKFFKGEKKIFAPRAGTIPKATNLPFTHFLNPDLTYKKPEVIKKTLADHKVADGAVLFCATGGTAAVAWFAARILAGKKVRLYDGSVNEWAAVKTNPMVMGKVPEKKGK